MCGQLRYCSQIQTTGHCYPPEQTDNSQGLLKSSLGQLLVLLLTRDVGNYNEAFEGKRCHKICDVKCW